ncbi:unnamed protein product [Sphenostylis stenocarpa]|uniref:Uncharacterized protein n=1 Tax=Sphenostylis stenocarpa TaxID=92480 RepID=A0AA86T598_9FABA|nr:unnamed protein product [Sphenostylis stenocarpa]
MKEGSVVQYNTSADNWELPCFNSSHEWVYPHFVPTTSNNSFNPFPPYKSSHPFLLSSNSSNKIVDHFSLMEISSTFTTYFILILALSPFSRGESEALYSEIYEIDYRGPETHSSTVPPPHHFHIGKPRSSSQKGSLRGTKALRDCSFAENKVKKVHG